MSILSILMLSSLPEKLILQPKIKQFISKKKYEIISISFHLVKSSDEVGCSTDRGHKLLFSKKLKIDVNYSRKSS